MLSVVDDTFWGNVGELVTPVDGVAGDDNIVDSLKTVAARERVRDSVEFVGGVVDKLLPWVVFDTTVELKGKDVPDSVTDLEGMAVKAEVGVIVVTSVVGEVDVNVESVGVEVGVIVVIPVVDKLPLGVVLLAVVFTWLDAVLTVLFTVMICVEINVVGKFVEEVDVEFP